VISDFWFLDRDNNQQGPVPREDFIALIKEGKVGRDTLVWAVGMKNWQEASQIDDLASFCKPAAPPPPPSPTKIVEEPSVQRVLGKNRNDPTKDAGLAALAALSEQIAERNEFDLIIQTMKSGTTIDETGMELIQDPAEKMYLYIIYAISIPISSIFALVIFVTIINDPRIISYYLVFVFYGAIIWLANFIAWRLAEASFMGHAMEVAPDQYPQIYSIVSQASKYLDIKLPRVSIYQGHGLVEMFVAKRFSRKGMLMITSNLVDELAKKSNSRGFMMIVGRQLGRGLSRCPRFVYI